jgi:hypothetical protein
MRRNRWLLYFFLAHFTLANGQPLVVSRDMFVAAQRPIKGMYDQKCQTLISTLGGTFCVVEPLDQVEKMLGGENGKQS